MPGCLYNLMWPKRLPLQRHFEQNVINYGLEPASLRHSYYILSLYIKKISKIFLHQKGNSQRVSKMRVFEIS